MFYFDSVVRYSEIGAGNHMTLTAVLDLMQDCSAFHSESVGEGLSYLRQVKRTWVLSSWQTVVCRYPALGEKVRVYTWPYAFKGFMGSRNFKIEDERGEVLAYADSFWIYLDTENGKPAKIPPEAGRLYQLDEPYDMERKGRKIPMREGMRAHDPVKAGRCHIDTNCHVNNGKYVQMAEEYLPDGFATRELRAEYKKSAVLSDMIYPKSVVNGQNALVSLEDAKGEPYAVIEFTGK